MSNTISSDLSNNDNNSISFTGMLTILFIGLKLTNHIDWSWWWVLSPIWSMLVIVFVLTFVIGMLKSE